MTMTVRAEAGAVPGEGAEAEQAASPRSSSALKRIMKIPVTYLKKYFGSALVSGHNTLVAGKGSKKTRMDAVKLLPEVIQRLLAVSNTDLLLHEVCAPASDPLPPDEVSLLLIDPHRSEP